MLLLLLLATSTLLGRFTVDDYKFSVNEREGVLSNGKSKRTLKLERMWLAENFYEMLVTPSVTTSYQVKQVRQMWLVVGVENMINNKKGFILKQLVEILLLTSCTEVKEEVGAFD